MSPVIAGRLANEIMVVESKRLPSYWATSLQTLQGAENVDTGEYIAGVVPTVLGIKVEVV